MPLIQIRNEQIKDLEITNSKIATSAGIETGKLADGNKFIQNDGSVSFAANQSMGSNKLTDLAAPTNDNDAVRKIDLENAGGTIVTREVPSGSINGSNTTFTLANTPLAGSESVYLNGNLLNSGGSNDYTISGDTITMASAPQSGDQLLVSYFIGGIIIPGVLPVSSGGTGQTTEQEAIDALTQVSGATTGQILTKDGSGNATFQDAPLGLTANNVQTTDATLTTVATIPIPDDTTYAITALISGNGPTGKHIWIDIKCGGYREGVGSATLLGDAIITFDDVGATTYTADVSVSGNDLLIQVQGAAAETVDWNCKHFTA